MAVRRRRCSICSAKLYADYLHSTDDTGFIDSTLSQRDLVSGVDILKNSGRRDDSPFAGITYQVTPALLLTGAFYYDHMKNAAIGGGATDSCNRYTGVAVAEYALSKRTKCMARSTSTR